MTNKDIIKELAELCKKYAYEIFESTGADDEYITQCAFEIIVRAGEIIFEIKKELKNDND